MFIIQLYIGWTVALIIHSTHTTQVIIGLTAILMAFLTFHVFSVHVFINVFFIFWEVSAIISADSFHTVLRVVNKSAAVVTTAPAVLGAIAKVFHVLLIDDSINFHI